MKLKEFPAKVDLVTPSKVLEDFILSEFPGIIKEGQIAKLGVGEKSKSYSFLELDGRLLREFLTYYDKYPYRILDSKTYNSN